MRVNAPFVYLFAATGLAVVGNASADVVVVANNAGDDTAAILAAFDAAGPGGTVVLAAGEYTISSNGGAALHLGGRDGVTLMGAGMDQTTIRFTGTTADSADLVDFSGSTDLTFMGFTLTGDGRADVNSGFVAFGSGSGHTWTDVAVTDIAPVGTVAERGFVGAGIFTNGVDDLTITNSRFQNVGTDAEFGAAVRIEESTGATISGNQITSTGRNGIVLKQAAGSVITDNVIRDTGTWRDYAIANNVPNPGDLDGLGIELFSEDQSIESKNRDHVVQGNTVDAWISVDRGSNIAIRDNVIDGVGSDRVQLAGLEIAGEGQNILVVGNTVKQADGAGGNQYVGLSISNAGPKNQILIAKNFIDAAEQYGMQLQGDDGNNDGEIRRLVVAQNTISNTSKDGNFNPGIGDTNSEGTGVRLLNGVFDAAFIDNVINSNGGFGVAMGSIPTDVDEIAFAENTITANNGNDADLVIDFGVTIGDTWAGDAVHFSDNIIDGGEPTVEEGGIQPLVVTVTLQESVVAGEEVTLSLNLDDAEYQALWDMGDGLPLLGTTVTYVFDEDGTVNVAVWDSEGVGGFVSFEVTVIPEPIGASGALGLGALALRRRR
ncbi:MAG: right-handed parallel beta-helix repeat-containing protein [Planctomycetota bacterium]